MSFAEPSTLISRVLHLEQQLESYRQLHNEELDQIRRALQDLKDQVLFLAEQQTAVDQEKARTTAERESQ